MNNARNIVTFVFSLGLLISVISGCSLLTARGKNLEIRVAEVEERIIVLKIPIANKAIWIRGPKADDNNLVTLEGRAPTIQSGRLTTLTVVGDAVMQVQGVTIVVEKGAVMLNGRSMENHRSAVIEANGAIFLGSFIRDFD